MGYFNYKPGDLLEHLVILHKSTEIEGGLNSRFGNANFLFFKKSLK